MENDFLIIAALAFSFAFVIGLSILVYLIFKKPKGYCSKELRDSIDREFDYQQRKNKR